MTRIVIKELVWDETRNLRHIRKHNITKDEVEEAGRNLIYHQQGRKGLYLAVGRSKLRLIFIVLNRESAGRYYLITARDAGKNERKVVYEKEQKK